MFDSATTTFWLALHGALVVSLLLRNGVEWHLLGTVAGFGAMFALEGGGTVVSPVVPLLRLPSSCSCVPMLLIAGGMLPLMFRNVQGRSSPLCVIQKLRYLRQPSYLSVVAVTLGMLLLSGSVVLFVLWNVIAAECVRLAQKDEETV